MASSPLLLGQEEKDILRKLAQFAEDNPFDVRAALEMCKTPEGTEAHKKRLQPYTVFIPTAFLVTFTVEEQPFGLCRHMSMSSKVSGRIPHPAGLWMVAKELGFWGSGIAACDHGYPEDLPDNRKAVHLMQRWEQPKLQ